jgi:hypothetical protein
VARQQPLAPLKALRRLRHVEAFAHFGAEDFGQDVPDRLFVLALDVTGPVVNRAVIGPVEPLEA